MQFAAVCVAVIVVSTFRGRQGNALDHTMQSPLKLSFGRR